MNAPNGYRIINVSWEITNPDFGYGASHKYCEVAIPISFFTEEMSEYADNGWVWELPASYNDYNESLRTLFAMQFDETSQIWRNVGE